MSELKPCPHCGESLVEHADHHGTWWAHKNEPAPCAHGVTQLFDNEDFEAWNRRTPSLPASAEGGEATGWRDMGSAPLDGTWVNILTTHHKVIPARWDASSLAWEICNIKVRAKAWQPLPEPLPREPIELHGSAALKAETSR